MKQSPGIASHTGFHLNAGGVCGDLFRSINWSNHPMGTPDLWPSALKVTLNILFHSQHPMFIWWGPDLIQFYNDAYMPSFLSSKHPKAMGQKGEECWEEIWPIVKPQIDLVMQHGGSTWNVNHLVPIFRNGKLEDVYWTYGYSPIFNEDGSVGGTLVVCTETTAQILAAEELKIAKMRAEEAMQQAESANALKTAFLANMSHEIRTPLGAILGFTDILRTDFPSQEQRDHYLDVIGRNGHALIQILDDILDLSKIEAGKVDIGQSPLCLTELTQDVVTMFMDRALDKNIQLRFNKTSFPHFKIKSDAVRIRQVLINLIGNAIKFTNEGGVVIHANHSYMDPDTAIISIFVTDTGIGMTEQQATQLFEPFHQGDNTSTRRYGGTGLGLALSKKLGLALGGDVSVENFSEGIGCTFKFELKATVLAGELLHTSHDSNAATFEPRRRLKGKNFLVVDDCADNRTLIELFLQREGALVHHASDGSHGVQMALEHDYDAVLMDIQMPGIDGYEALAKLQNLSYAKPVLALTAHAMKEEKSRTLAMGFRDHITKPINPATLIDSILTHTKISASSNSNLN